MDKDESSCKQIEIVDISYQTNAKNGPIGTVCLIQDEEVILIPTPSPDPQDPLNLNQWRKGAVLVVLSFCLVSITSVLLTSAMGSIFIDVKASYDNDPRATDLMTYPTLFMGIGNLIAMPLAMAIGRRPIFLASALLLVIGSIWCATSTSLGSHIAGRDLMSLAAGQSEALCPLIIQEFYFLHERGRTLAMFSAMQSIGSAALTIATTYLTSSLGWRWWYGVFAIVNGIIFIFSYLLVPESRYNRPSDAFDGAVHISARGENSDRSLKATIRHGIHLDLATYKPRTWKSDLRIYIGPANWKAASECWVQMGQCVLFPNILWIVLMNSCVLGIYVVMVSEFATILVAPPYNFAFTSLGFVQGGQIIVSIIMVPVLGYGTDILTKTLARRNQGISEPEYRLIPLILPCVVVVISCVFFGLAGSHSHSWSPWTVIISYNAEYFGFIGIVLIGFTYSLDSLPERAAPVLVLICAVRGIVSFGISFGVTDFISSQGYQGALVICAILMGVLSLLGIPIFIFGKQIRGFVGELATAYNHA